MGTPQQNCGGWTKTQEDGWRLEICGWTQKKPREADEALLVFC